MATPTNGRKSDWDDQNTVTLLLTIMQQTNPSLSVTGWKQIEDQMNANGAGITMNIIKKRFNAVRDQFEKAGNDLTKAPTSNATTTPKRKRTAKNDESIAFTTPSKKVRGKEAEASSDEILDPK